MPQRYRLVLPGLLLTALLPLAARAQANFQPGYVVLPAGDTLRGEIDLRVPDRNARECRFRPGAQGTLTVYTPTGLRAYGTGPGPGAGGQHYTSLAVPAAEAGSAPTAYFMRCLVTGPARLYFLPDERYFVLGPGAASPAELRQLTVRTERDGHLYDEVQPLYRRTLAQALPGCPTVQSQLPTLPYYERSLRQLVASYNACLSPTAVATASSRPSPYPSVLLGPSLTRLSLRSGPDFYNDVDFTASLGVALGLAYTVPLRNRRLALHTELYYENQHYQQQVFNPFVQTRPSELELRLGYLRLPVLLRYGPQRGALRPFVEAGFTLAYAVQAETRAVRYLNLTRTTDGPLFVGEGLRRTETGFAAGVGVQGTLRGGRPGTVQLRYERSNGMSGYTGTTTLVQHVGLLLSVALTRPTP